MVSADADANGAPVVLDDTPWPVVVFTFPPRCDEDHWRAHFRTYDRLYRRREPFHVVSDLTGLVIVPSAGDRRLIAELSLAAEELTKRWVLGSAIVVPNPLMRAALVAVTWLAAPVYKLTFHGTAIDAFDEATSTVEKHGIALPETTLRFRERLARR